MRIAATSLVAEQDITSMSTPGLVRFVTARTVSILGDRLAETALPMVILLATQDALLAGLVTAANMAPTFLIALPVGHYVDLRERRRLMITADIWRAVLAAGLAIALLAPHPPAAILIGVSFLLGCGDVLFNVSAQSYLPALVPSARIMRANTALETGDAAATLAGPALAGAVLARFSASVAIVLNSASFLLSALLLLRLPNSRLDQRRDPGEDATHAKHAGMLAGVRLLIGDPTQRLLQIATAYMYVAAGSSGVMVISLAVQALRLRTVEVGLLLSAAGVGGLLVGLVVARMVERAPWGPLLGLVLFGLALTCLWLGASPSFGIAFPAVLLMDGCSALAFITAGSARQLLTPADRLGRVTAAAGVLNGVARTLGAAGGGTLVVALGARGALMTLGGCGIAAAIPLLLSRVARFPLTGVPQRDVKSAPAGTS
ncbi:MFS transporter [Streptomyces sp. NPDC003077]|uniref:MFS transporter n=1 Tax=Streptomyces sp. NPDC003077 TaxID=3154443 RepID=UPI0033BDE15F